MDRYLKDELKHGERKELQINTNIMPSANQSSYNDEDDYSPYFNGRRVTRREVRESL